MKLWKQSGNLLIITGLIHNLFGFVVGWPTLLSMYNSGVYNSIGNDMEKNAVFWFLITGFLIMLSGHLGNQFIRLTYSPLPKSFGIYLLILAVVGCFMIPASGFWLFFPQVIIILFPGKETLPSQKATNSGFK